MERNTIIAIILSTIILTVGFFLQNVLFSPSEPSSPIADTSGDPVNESPAPDDSSSDNASGRNSSGGQQFTVLETNSTAAVDREIIYEQTEFLRVVMDTRGGNIREVILLSHEDNGRPMSLFFGDSDMPGLNLSLGDIGGQQLDPLFYYRRNGEAYEFYQDIVLSGQDDPFQIVKRYRFYQDEYFFEMEIELVNSVNEYVPLNFDGKAYTISIGPQIGPEFTEIGSNSRTDFRKFSYLDSNKRKDIRNLSGGERQTLEGLAPWAAINGKYFVAVAIPGNTGADIVFTTDPASSGVQGNQLHLIRPEIQSSKVTDKYRFYFGPKSASELRKYENGEDNQPGITNLGLETLVESSWLGWLENILKTLMGVFYGLIPNWGISIILLTILVKLVLYPLTNKSYESTAKMKELSPKIAELREKHKDDSQKLNQATMELYKKEKVNPLGGCLPMLLQFPFFIAMFSLFNNNFDLRGATFIPGWITDLSSPESVINFGFTIPLLNWDALRILPILFLITQLFTTKLTQPADAAQSNPQMKMMTLGLPIIFFFIMYNLPSGLLIYWIFQNVISTGQQLAYNYFAHKKAQKDA